MSETTPVVLKRGDTVWQFIAHLKHVGSRKIDCVQTTELADGSVHHLYQLEAFSMEAANQVRPSDLGTKFWLTEAAARAAMMETRARYRREAIKALRNEIAENRAELKKLLAEQAEEEGVNV